MGTADIIAIASTLLWITSEALAQIPKIKQNSVFQVVYSILSKGNIITKLFTKK